MRLNTKVQFNVERDLIVEVDSEQAFDALLQTFARSRGVNWDAFIVITGDEGLGKDPKIYELKNYRGQWVRITAPIDGYHDWTITPIRKADKFELQVWKEIQHIRHVIFAWESSR